MHWLRLPVKGKQSHILHPCYLPHEFFSTLHSERPELFERWIRGPLGAAKCFGEKLRGSQIFENHGALNPLHFDKLLPIGLHGDGGSFSKQDSLMVLSWNGVLGTMSGTEKGFARRFLFTVIRKTEMLESGETMDYLWKVFSWSVNLMLTGINGEQDYEGRPLNEPRRFLASGYRASLMQIRGDWEFLSNVIKLVHWGRSGNMCFLCKAENEEGPLKWHNVGESAGWRSTLRTHSSWKEELRRDNLELPLLFRLVVGLSLACVAIDVLHCVDAGVGAHIVGNIMMLCIKRNVWGGGTMDRNAECLDEELTRWHSKNKSKRTLQGEITVARLRSTSGYTKLKGKASAVRHISEFGLELAQKYLTHDKRLVAIITLLCRFYRILASEGLHMSADAKKSIPKIGNQICKVYHHLARGSANKC